MFQDLPTMDPQAIADRIAELEADERQRHLRKVFKRDVVGWKKTPSPTARDKRAKARKRAKASRKRNRR